MKRRNFLAAIVGFASAVFMPKKTEYIINDEIGPPTVYGDNLFCSRTKPEKTMVAFEYWDGGKWTSLDVELTNCKIG